MADLAPLLEPTGKALSILAQMKLAALPGNRGKHRSSSGLQSRVVVTDDELHSLESPPGQILKKRSPVDLRLAQPGAQTQDLTVTGSLHTDCLEDGQVLNSSIDTDFLVMGVQVDEGILTAQRPATELLQLLIQQGGDP